MSQRPELVQCPYDRSHLIQPHAMPKHLYKCRKNHPWIKLACCPFNTAHRVPKPELKLHTASCEDRATFEVYKYCVASEPEKRPFEEREPRLIYNDRGVSSAGSGKTLLDDDDECWDNCNEPAYNPQQYCRSANIIRKATLMKPSQKKQFYREEQKRLSELRQRENSSSRSSSSSRNSLADDELDTFSASFASGMKIQCQFYGIDINKNHFYQSLVGMYIQDLDEVSPTSH
ncbi:gametocyte-specific factor 1 homolog [Uranotaenia lowii]|uniref:gametocyte-specific factor 1 homolog n=1 Tax=Uranotaenia lowii TaxID=190385 RepID=UPI002478C3F0|nr:gametocyte-specific factor 1 homolog [Uranotaenia lowii]